MTIKIDLESCVHVPQNAWIMHHNKNGQKLRTAYREHLFRQQGLRLCKELIHLMIALQKHRGCTLAILSGDQFFETRLYSIQSDITEQLNTIEAQHSEYLSRDESRQLIREWVCIRRQWSKDSPEQNFLLHSNLIAELLKLVRQVVTRAGIADTRPDCTALASFSFCDWLNMIESAAQARGLATHCAVKEHCAAEIRSRLRFLHRQLMTLDQQFEHTLNAIAPLQARTLKERTARLDYRAYLDQFLEMLKHQFCDQATPGTDADSIYTAGSHVVSACQHILDCMLRIIETKPDPELEDWIYGQKKASLTQWAATEHADPTSIERHPCFAAE